MREINAIRIKSRRRSKEILVEFAKLFEMRHILKLVFMRNPACEKFLGRYFIEILLCAYYFKFDFFET